MLITVCRYVTIRELASYWEQAKLAPADAVRANYCPADSLPQSGAAVPLPLLQGSVAPTACS